MSVEKHREDLVEQTALMTWVHQSQVTQHSFRRSWLARADLEGLEGDEIFVGLQVDVLMNSKAFDLQGMIPATVLKCMICRGEENSAAASASFRNATFTCMSLIVLTVRAFIL